MNDQEARQRLFDETFLLGSWRRRKALKFLFDRGDAEAARILVDAVDLRHPAASTIQQFLSHLTEREPLDALVASWAAKRQPWLGPIAAERALSTGGGAALPLDRETAWLVVPHISAGGERGVAAEAYVQRAIQQQPDFLLALLFKIRRSEILEKNSAAAAGALRLLDDGDADVRSAGQAFLSTFTKAEREPGWSLSLRHIPPAEAIRIVVDAVDRSHPAASTIQQFLSRLTEREPLDALVASWAAKRQPWLGPIAVERVLSTGGVAALPLDRETAWLIVPHLSAGGERAAAAEAYVQRAIQQQPDFLPALVFKILRSEILQKNCAAAAGALTSLKDADAVVRSAAQAFLSALTRAGSEAARSLSLRHIPPSEAVRILVDAVDRSHSAASTIQQFLSRLTEREPLDALVASWAAKRQPWLGPIAVERALSTGGGAALPLDRETAWLIVPHVSAGGERGAAAEAYVQRAIQQQPDLLALVFKLGRGKGLDRSRSVQARVLELLKDPDAEVRNGAEAWLKALPNTQQWNDLIVDEWIRAQSPFLATLVAEPRLPSNPAKEALIHLVNRNVAGYRRLEDADGGLLAEAFALASPQMRQVINEVVLGAKDGALADAYRRACSADTQADPQLALRALMASGNEDALFEMARGMTLAEVLPLCAHWSETRRRPTKEKARAVVDRAIAALGRAPKLEIEPAPPLPDGITDLLEAWQSEKLTHAQLRQNLNAPDPFVRARALFAGSERGEVDAATLRGKASSEHWPERLVVALRHPGVLSGKDQVEWIHSVAAVDNELLGVRMSCGPEELQRTQALCVALRNSKGALAAHQLALAETLAAFQAEFSGGSIRVLEDDSAHQKGAVRVAKAEVSPDDLKF